MARVKETPTFDDPGSSCRGIYIADPGRFCHERCRLMKSVLRVVQGLLTEENIGSVGCWGVDRRSCEKPTASCS